MSGKGIELSLRLRPCLLGREHRGLFYGFTVHGFAMVELEAGKLEHWPASEVTLLDSHYEFEKYNWEGLRRGQTKN